MWFQIGTWICLSLALYFFLALAHMFGHLLASTMFKSGLENASLGIGPKLFRIWRTQLFIRIPVIHCEDLNFGSDGRGLNLEPDEMCKGVFWRKAVVIAAGPIVSFLLSAVFLAFISAAGTSVVLPIIGDVQSGSPADEAGLENGDKILSMDNQTVSSWREMAEIIADSSANPIRLRVERGATLKTLIVRPEIRTIPGFMGEEPQQRPIVGITSANVVEVRSPPGWRVPLIGISEAGNLTRSVAEGFFDVFREQPSQKNIVGPLATSQLAVDEAGSVFRLAFFWIASFSASIAFITLLPLPIFDGGQFVYLIVETIRGRRISSHIKQRLRRITIVLILTIGAIGFLQSLGDLISG